MKTEITKSSWDDMIFESRNKEYGAYCIRKSHDENVSKGFFVALLFGAFLFGVVQVASLLKIEVPIPLVKTKKLDPFYPLKEILTPILKKLSLKPEPVVNKNLLTRVVTHDVIETPLPKAEQPTTTENQIGTTTSGNANTDVETTSNTANSIPLVIEPPPVFITAEVMPEYEGGVIAMTRFLSRQLHYPTSERSVGHEGTVYIQFVVNSAGQVVDVEAIRGISSLLDKEATRVVSLMTKWKPGRQHDIPVNVRMVLPIKFQLQQ